MNNTILYTNPYRQGMKEVIEYNEPKIISQKSFLTLNIQQQKHKLQFFKYISHYSFECFVHFREFHSVFTLPYASNITILLEHKKSIKIIKAFNNNILCFLVNAFYSVTIGIERIWEWHEKVWIFYLQKIVSNKNWKWFNFTDFFYYYAIIGMNSCNYVNWYQIHNDSLSSQHSN